MIVLYKRCMKPENLLTTSQVAAQLNVTIRRVRALIEAGRLPSQQYGRDHLIKAADLKLVEDRKPGRPSVQKAAVNRSAKIGTKKVEHKSSTKRR